MSRNLFEVILSRSASATTNMYDRLATVHTRKGTQKFLEVNVWADPTGAMFYQMEASSAANLIDAANKEQHSQGWGSS